jgi:hypothetical protein
MKASRTASSARFGETAASTSLAEKTGIWLKRISLRR